MTQDGGHHSDSDIGIVVLPEPQRGPCLLCEMPIGVQVTSLGAGNFSRPPIGIVLWWDEMVGTSMPEATVYKNG